MIKTLALSALLISVSASVFSGEFVENTKRISISRDFNHEGYQIEIWAKTLTLDALPALEAKAKQGDVIAQTTLGWAYLLGKGQIDGRGIPRSNPKMLRWTLAAARHGYPVAQNNLGAIYMGGVGVKLDYDKARQYYKLAAEQGYFIGQKNLLELNAMLDGKMNPEQVGEMYRQVQRQPVHLGN
jgi:hypothetical protein